MVTISQLNTINQNFCCPNCKRKPVSDSIIESCDLVTTQRDNIYLICVKAKQFKAFAQITFDNENNADNYVNDPCIKCKHNKITKISGTFIEMRQLGFIDNIPQFIEIHQCKCGTIFEIPAII